MVDTTDFNDLCTSLKFIKPKRCTKIMVRIKNRYIVVQVIPYKSTDVLYMKEAKVAKSILNHVEKFYGVYGLSVLETGFRVKYCNERTKIAIVRCLHRAHRFVTSTLPIITKIGEVHAKFRTLYVGATIIHCNKFIVRHQQNFLDRYAGQIASAKERNDLIKRVLEFDLDN